MAKFSIPDWSPEFSVGNPQIDAQHQQLTVLGQQALALLQLAQADARRFHQLLNDITDAVRLHFKTEETVLQANHYPLLREHRAQHDQFIEQLTSLLYDGTNGEVHEAELARLAYDLVVRHMVEEDLPLKAYMQPSGRH
jgi:hemerythrin-like metal-binding protein